MGNLLSRKCRNNFGRNCRKCWTNERRSEPFRKFSMLFSSILNVLSVSSSCKFQVIRQFFLQVSSHKNVMERQYVANAVASTLSLLDCVTLNLMVVEHRSMRSQCLPW